MNGYGDSNEVWNDAEHGRREDGEGLGTVDGMDSPCLRLAGKTRETKGLNEQCGGILGKRSSPRERRYLLLSTASLQIIRAAVVPSAGRLESRSTVAMENRSEYRKGGQEGAGHGCWYGALLQQEAGACSAGSECSACSRYHRPQTSQAGSGAEPP